MKRELIYMFVPWPFVLVNHYLVIVAAPIMFYLFVSGLTPFAYDPLCLVLYR